MPVRPKTDPVRRSASRLALAWGLTAWVAVVATLFDPGVTVDEPLDVRPGRTYLSVLRATGWRFFTPEVVDRVFRDNAEHPPLGRWLLGIASTVGEPAEVLIRGPDPVGIYTRAGRLAPATAFALLVGLVVRIAAIRFGPSAGFAAGFALLAMPRIFAHAHLGALDTFVAATWTLAVLAADGAIRREKPVGPMALAGIALGLALLTKIHGWLLFPTVFAWTCLNLRGRPKTLALAFACWAFTGLLVFVAGWPWLWYDGLTRLRDYLSTGWQRTPIRVLYFGQVYLDRKVPWHYPWLYFAATVPIGLHALGIVGVVSGWKRRREESLPLLLLGVIGGFLLLFSTGTPVYDGERLYLVVFPLWSILIGLGFRTIWHRIGMRRWLRGMLAVALIGQLYGTIAFHPFGLSYYNALVGGLPGAETFGLELTYWNDAVDDPLLAALANEVQPGATAALVPTLHPEQGKVNTTRALLGKQIVLQDDQDASQVDWLVVSRRTAYWPPDLESTLRRQPPVAVRSRQGVWLSGVWRQSRVPRKAPLGNAALP